MASKRPKKKTLATKKAMASKAAATEAATATEAAAEDSQITELQGKLADAASKLKKLSRDLRDARKTALDATATDDLYSDLRDAANEVINASGGDQEAGVSKAAQLRLVVEKFQQPKLSESTENIQDVLGQPDIVNGVSRWRRVLPGVTALQDAGIAAGGSGRREIVSFEIPLVVGISSGKGLRWEICVQITRAPGGAFRLVQHSTCAAEAKPDIVIPRSETIKRIRVPALCGMNKSTPMERATAASSELGVTTVRIQYPDGNIWTGPRAAEFDSALLRLAEQTRAEITAQA